MTQGIDAGPYGTPNRWRPIDWPLDGTTYTWERPISTQQTGFSFVSQSRAGLPDAVGGVLWYGLDDTYFSCYVPLYCGIDALPEAYTIGQLNKFSWDDAPRRAALGGYGRRRGGGGPGADPASRALAPGHPAFGCFLAPAAFAALYETLVTLCRLLAPAVPCLADELYQNLVKAAGTEAPLSVHLCDFPAVDGSVIDTKLENEIALARTIVSLS
jgi:hypothetical protein